VMLTADGASFLASSLGERMCDAGDGGYFIPGRSVEQIGSFVVIECTPETTPRIKGNVNFWIPLQCVKLMVSGSAAEIGFLTTKHRA
jgi:hypothetical protein